MKAEVQEAIKENFRSLLQLFVDGGISYEEIKELEQEAISDEEYEIAESIKQVLTEIDSKQ